MNKSYGLNIVKWIALIFISIFILSQLYMAVYNPLTTDTAIYYDAYDGLSTSGLIIRDEAIINSELSGVKSYEVSEGGRVSKNGVIATVYNNESVADTYLKIDELNRQIDTLTNVQTYNDLNAADLTLINTKISNTLISILSSVQTGNLSQCSEEYDTLLTLMNRKQIVTGEVTDFNSLITKLKTERDSLTASIETSCGEIRSNCSGYFISSVDGYEGLISTDKLRELTYETLLSLTPDTNQSANIVGKVVQDYEWYIAATVPLDDSLDFVEGSTLTLRTQLTSTPELTVNVKHVNKSASGNNAVVVFSCKSMNEELAQTRNMPITIIKKSYTGLRVNSSAIRVVNGIKGVYVYESSQANFVEVKILYSAGNYSICELNTEDADSLRLYDEIIVKGKNLYDGKIIQ
ncbi:MAG: HlyD family efflux transporter periplasmic adaptor subunit [Oscillospiraceae bacterium]|nr:HlyD family efflux transporter periplasmic adaptor subunit [Oscillospiraceae bacterium]